jgi:hypothetical protein
LVFEVHVLKCAYETKLLSGHTFICPRGYLLPWWHPWKGRGINFHLLDSFMALVYRVSKRLLGAAHASLKF